MLTFVKKHLKIEIIFALLLCSSLYGETIGIIGGKDLTGTQPAYAALLSADGTLSDLSGGGFPLIIGQISGVAINNSGNGLIGGKDQTGSGPAYAALIAPNGTLTSLSGGSFPSTSGIIGSTAINNFGNGIIGGQNTTGASTAYAALVASNGTLTNLSGGGFPSTSGSISSVAINNTGAGIIGGQDTTGTSPAYAALVAPNGTLTDLSGGGFPSTSGNISSVAINNTGAGIIGGQDTTGTSPAYAALVAPNGTLTDLSGGGFPSTSGFILSVAINNAGMGIIGGQDITGTSPAYAALVAPNGTLTNLSGGSFPSTSGIIRSVAINSTGAGIIGGSDFIGSLPVYAALVAPNGTLTDLSGGSFSSVIGDIYSVAINEEGIGLIGGQDFAGGFPAYAAIVAPNGTVTDLIGGNFPSTTGSILSVALNSEEILDGVVPKSYGPGSSYVNSVFSLTTQVLPNHAMYHHKEPYNRGRREANPEISLLADATDQIRTNTPCLEDPDYDLWLTGFGAYALHKKESNFVALNNWIGGAMLGFDYKGIDNAVIGAGFAYAYNHVHYSEGAGKARFHQEFLTLYGSWNQKHLFINAALWGGLYQLRNERTTFEKMTSKANIDGWLLVPHLEIGTPFHAMGEWFVIEPFVMVDWANNWQGKVREHGASGLNLKFGSTYTSLLRTEAGLRFFESIHYQWGDWILEEKASYANKLPFNTNRQSTAFVASASSFAVEVFSNKTQNLGVVQLSSHFIPCSNKYPYGALNYQGEFGSAFQSHLVSIEIGKYF